jgi:hypothetical protein
MVHELGLERCKTVWFLSFVVNKFSKTVDFSTRGPNKGHLWYMHLFINKQVAKLSANFVIAENI